MAKNISVRIPLINKTISASPVMWAAAAAAAIGGYFILANKDIGIPFIDQPLEQIGDITGLEGQGSSLIPSIFGPPQVAADSPAMTAPAAIPPANSQYYLQYSNAYLAGTDYDDLRISNI